MDNERTHMQEELRKENARLREQLAEARQLLVALRGESAVEPVIADREREAHFRLALGNLPISFWNMDSDLRYVWVHHHEKGADAQAILGKTDAEIFSPEDAAYITKLKKQVIETGWPLSKEVFATVEGRIQHYNYYLEPLRNEAGGVTGLTGAAVNVTNIHELEATRKSLSDALKQSGSATIMINNDLNFEFFNGAFTELFGYTHDELSGQSINIISPPVYTPTLLPMQVREIAEKTERFRGEVLRKHKSGELIPVYLTATWLKNQEGAVTGFVASYNDLRPIRYSQQQLKEALTGTISAISHIIEKRDPYTAGHQQRVAQLASAIAAEMGLEQHCIEGIYLGGLIHDIGKIYVPAEVLNRPGKLSEHEFGLIKAHAEVGYEIVKEINFNWPIADMVYQHHERIDGSGYPQGLIGHEISLEAKIISVADIVEAISSHRPYRPGPGLEAALMEVDRKAGITLDKDIVAHCLRLFRENRFRWERFPS